MFIEIKFKCTVAKSGYEFDEHGMVRPKDPSQGFKQIPLDEIAVFEFTDLFEYLDAEYKTGLPSRTEQVEILRFYNHWGFLQLPEEESEPASIIIRSMRDFWFTSGFAPIQIDIKEEKDTLFGQPKLLMHSLSLVKERLDESMYTTCQYYKIYGEKRGRRGKNSGSCPPKCRVKKQPITKFNPNGNSWGKKCQKVHDNKVRRANEKGEEERSKK